MWKKVINDLKGHWVGHFVIDNLTFPFLIWFLMVIHQKNVLYDSIKIQLRTEFLLVLKREANDKLVVLVTYLQVMAAKAPEAYGKPYAVVTAIITRLNDTYTGGAPKASKRQADAEGTSEAMRVAMRA